MLNKYYKLLQDKNSKDDIFINSVLEICTNLDKEDFSFKFILNKEDFLKIKILAPSPTRFYILENKEEISKKFKENINQQKLIVLIV